MANCAPHAEAGQGPAPCERIDLAHGDDQGVALLKDLVGLAQFLAIPTRRVTGIEDPFVLDPPRRTISPSPGPPAMRWPPGSGGTLPREDVSIAINSAFARSQDQLHLHLDCLDPGVAATLAGDLEAFDETWRPMAEPLKGRVYWARRVLSDDLSGVRPLALLADGRSRRQGAHGRRIADRHRRDVRRQAGVRAARRPRRTDARRPCRGPPGSRLRGRRKKRHERDGASRDVRPEFATAA